MSLEIHDRLIAKMLDLTVQRQRLSAQNLANAETPGYVRKELAFEEQLAKAVRQGAEALPGVQGEIVEDQESPFRLDGNNVTVAKELNEMSENAIMHSLLSRAYTSRLRIMKNAIT